MATLFKPTRPYPLPADAEIIDKDGKPHVRIREKGKAAFYPLTKDGTKYLKPSEKWYAKHRDANGAITLTPLSPNKDAARMMLTALLKRIEDQKSGIRSDFTDHRARSLSELLAEYEQHATDRNISTKQAGQTRRRCEMVFEGCQFLTLAHLNGVAAERWLAERRRLTKKDGGISTQTSNHYVAAFKAFGAWLVMTHKVAENPFRFVTKGNVDVDVRHVRRALVADEFNRLLDATRSGVSYRGLSGPDRAILYLVAGMTGLRASELASLIPVSFSLDDDTPIVTVEAAYSKHRRRDEVPLHPALVAELRPWLSPKPKGAPLWGGKWAKQYSAAAMIRRDLDAARAAWISEATEKEREQRENADFLKYRDQGGEVVDFHALRHTFVTNLVNAGVMPKDAMELARHSTITLTMDRYAHVGIRDTAAAVAKLVIPTTSRPTPESASLKATGTDGGCTTDVPPDVPTTGNGRLRLRTGENVEGTDEGKPETLKPLQLQGFEDDQGRSTNGEGGIRTLDALAGISVFETPPRHTGNATNPGQLARSPSPYVPVDVPTPTDPELVRVITFWPRLPAHIKAAVLALLAVHPVPDEHDNR